MWAVYNCSKIKRFLSNVRSDGPNNNYAVKRRALYTTVYCIAWRPEQSAVPGTTHAELSPKTHYPARVT